MKRINFVFAMWNFWDSLGFLVIGIYSLNKEYSVLITIAMFIASLFFFSVWVNFIYNLIAKSKTQVNRLIANKEEITK